MMIFNSFTVASNDYKFGVQGPNGCGRRFFLPTNKTFYLTYATDIKIYLHLFGTEGDVTRDDSQGRFLAQQSVAILEQCCNHSKQCRNNVVTLCCAKNRLCESSCVT